MAGKRNGKRRSKNNRMPLYGALGLLVLGVVLVEGLFRQHEYPEVNTISDGTLPILNQQDPFDAVFIDVGQGDCELIVSKGQAVLIDGGEKEYGATVVDKLRRMGIERLDVVVGTHDHSDHIGSLGYVVEHMDVGQIYLPPVRGSGSSYTNLAEAAAEKNIPTLTGKPQDTFAIGDVVFTFLWPNPGQEEENLNNTSYVLSAWEEDVSLLLTGDIEKESEKELVEQNVLPDVDILKVAHHGSETSTTQAFLKECRPEYGMIEVGEGNSYHHPDMDIMKRLQEHGVQVFRTDVDGDIWVDVQNDQVVVQELEDRLAA